MSTLEGAMEAYRNLVHRITGKPAVDYVSGFVVPVPAGQTIIEPPSGSRRKIQCRKGRLEVLIGGIHIFLLQGQSTMVGPNVAPQIFAPVESEFRYSFVGNPT